MSLILLANRVFWLLHWFFLGFLFLHVHAHELCVLKYLLEVALHGLHGRDVCATEVLGHDSDPFPVLSLQMWKKHRERNTFSWNLTQRDPLALTVRSNCVRNLPFNQQIGLKLQEGRECLRCVFQ